MRSHLIFHISDKVPPLARASYCLSCLCPDCICLMTEWRLNIQRMGFKLQFCSFLAVWILEPVVLPFSVLGCKIGMKRTVSISWVKWAHTQRALRKCLAHNKDSLSIHFFSFCSLNHFFLFCFLLLDVLWEQRPCTSGVYYSQAHNKGLVGVSRIFYLGASLRL